LGQIVALILIRNFKTINSIGKECLAYNESLVDFILFILFSLSCY
jgi:hypothetical protein